MTSKNDPGPFPEERPFNLDPKVYGDVMDKHFRVAQGLGLTNARSTEEFFGFHYNQVAGFHYHKQGWGTGLFFRLRDGRVFDVMARPHDPDLSWYDQTTH
jgi:hypothetical protein